MSVQARSILDDLADLSADPLRFVLWAFPWQEPGTELVESLGPEPWQSDILAAVRDGLPLGAAIRLAVTSGHGVGKSALVAWLILWALSTSAHTMGVVTANTETQLKTKTWASLGKWHRLFIGRHLFKLTATSIFHPEHERTWRIDMVPWSERNTEAFAGLHNKGRRILLVFDEGSAIPDVIWEVAEGALTDQDTEIIWAVFGNPTKSTGRFRDCFPGGRFAHRWRSTRVDARTVSFTDKRLFQEWIDDYGEDADFVRVRVLGIFPRVGSQEFISAWLASEAASREVSYDPDAPCVLGVDVARFGDDASVIFIRRGRDARSHSPRVYRGLSTMELVAKVLEAAEEHRPDAIFVDEGGVGAGVIDRLAELRVRQSFGIQFGSKADRTSPTDMTKCANKRAEMWSYMREWLKGGAIPDGHELREQLVGPQYGFNGRDEIQLERKEDMKKRGLPSPDMADALALTFAYPVMAAEVGALRAPDSKVASEWDPLTAERLAA